VTANLVRHGERREPGQQLTKSMMLLT